MAKFKPLPPSGEQHKADNSYPITPPKKLVDQWFEASVVSEITYDEYNFANLAARWGWEQRGADLEAKLQKARDEELEACVEWLRDSVVTWNGEAIANSLHAARRPKPKSLAEKALKEASALCPSDTPNIRRALKRLREHEQQVEAQVSQ